MVDQAMRVGEPPGPAREPWWNRTGWRDPYWWVTGLLVLALVLVTLRHPWSFDFGVHAGTIERLRFDLVHPGNPMVDDPGSTIYYTPYTWFLGLVATVTGLSGRSLLGIMAPLMVGLFAVGLRAFVRTLTPARWAPLAALLCVLLLWGPRPVVWSGFPSFFSILLSASYPSYAALTATLFWWVWFTRALARPRVLHALGLGVVGAVIALTHPFTALTAAFGAAGILAYRARTSGAKAVALLVGGATVVALATVLVWPYYSLLSLAGSREFDEIHHGLYSSATVFFGLAIVTLPALWLRARRCWYDPLVVLFLLGVLTLVVGGLTGAYALARAWPAVLLAGQVATGVELATLVGAWRRWYRPVVALALAAGFVVQSGNLTYTVPLGAMPAVVSRNLLVTPQGPDFRWLAGHVHFGEVILAEPGSWNMALPGYGLRTVNAAWPDPFLPDYEQRLADARRLIQPDTPPPERLDLLRRRHVALILVPSNSTWRPTDWGLPAIAAVATGPTGQHLYRVTLSG